ncbi:unnamed protein product [Brassica oleracea]
MARGVLVRLLSRRFLVRPVPPDTGRSCGWFSVVGACGELLFSVLSPGLGGSVAARVEPRDSIRVSFGVSVFWFQALDCGNAFFALFSHNKCHLVEIDYVFAGRSFVSTKAS